MSGLDPEIKRPSLEEVREACHNVTTEAAAIAHAGRDSEGWEYEVFLSFRGSDTRTNFTDFLYEDLRGAGIRAFRDDDELRVGNDISNELIKGISQSKIYIPIFSQNYAESKWCLNELLDMVKHSEKKERVIMPIFYDVDPSDVKHQTGKFTEAFQKHEHDPERGVPKSQIRQWKEALRYVAELKGWEVKKRFDGHQGRLVKRLVSEVSERLNIAFLDITENLVGIEDQAEEVMAMLETESNDVKIVGICGMPGIGKTTFAKYLYNKLSTKFQHSSFLADVKERSKTKGIEKLQKQLILDILGTKVSNVQPVKVISERFRIKKALILIDDVDHSLQLQMLARKPEWFCPGSRIIITTRNKEVLQEYDINLHYEVKTLSPDNSLKLLSKHAFKKDFPLPHFDKLSRDIATTTGGHPLSLRTTGSLLHNKDEKLWVEILKKLRQLPEKEVLETLRLSYDALEEYQKEMFLDIACFFIGYERYLVSYMWESCDQFFPEYGVSVLMNMSLIKVDKEHKLIMHDHLKDLGRQIVREKTQQLGKPTRLWSLEEATKAFKGKNVGVDFVKALSLGNKSSENDVLKFHLTTNDLKSLCRLLYFQAGCADIHSDFKGTLPDLRWLQWSMHVKNSWTSTLSNFRPKSLVILDLSNSNLSDGWRGWKLIKDAKNLKVLNLSHCKKLKRTPSFPKDAILERLILRGCNNLVNLHPSVRHLKCLVILDLSDCESLKMLPLDFPVVENSYSIWTFTIPTSQVCSLSKPSTTSFREPQTTETLFQEEQSRALQVLNLKNCREIHSLPESIKIYKMLTELDLGHTNIHTIPDSIGDLSNLIVLIIRETPVSEFPNCIWNLQNLEVIDAYKCRELEGDIPPEIGGLSYLRILKLGFTKISSIPRTVSGLKRLEELDLSELNLGSLPELPRSLKRLTCSSKSQTSHLSKLVNLEELELDQGLFPISDIGSLYKLKCLTFKSYDTALPSGIGALQRLVILKIRSSSIRALPPEIASLPQPSELLVSDCNELIHLPRLPSSLSKLHLSFCCSLSNLGDISNLKYLCSLTIDRCSVAEIIGLQELQSLTELRLAYCHKLCTLEGLASLTCLTKLCIYCCVLLETLPDLSKMENLREIFNYGCTLQIKGISSTVRICSEKLQEFEY